MLKKTAVLGLALTLTGGALLEWTRHRPPPLRQLFPDAANIEVDSEAFSVGDLTNYQNMDQLLAGLRSKSKDELEKEQNTRLIAKIEQLASSKDQPEPVVADMLYGPNWQAKVKKYRRLITQQELAAISAIAIGIVGLVALTLAIICASVQMARAVGLASMHWMSTKKMKNALVSDDVLDTKPAYKAEAWPLKEASKLPPLETEKNTGPQPSTVTLVSKNEFVLPRLDAYCSPRLGFQIDTDEETKFDLFLTDQDSVHSHAAIDFGAPSWQERPGPELEAVAASSLEKRTDDLARQITQVQKLVTENTSQTEFIAEPFNETLHQLNDQISAIRQYASSQQDRVEKLQNGYDWNIIRTFCLRIIRCIDNLDSRIERLSDDSESLEMLSDIRDELLFSLESSSVEQFDLEHDSVFSGQERLAEAIKEKEITDNPELKGRIAQVVKPGYQYVLDDENVKIVRTARVKLYG
jgi:molecular chaperone GrpE (heat shock protein)